MKDRSSLFDTLREGGPREKGEKMGKEALSGREQCAREREISVFPKSKGSTRGRKTGRHFLGTLTVGAVSDALLTITCWTCSSRFLPFWVVASCPREIDKRFKLEEKLKE